MRIETSDPTVKNIAWDVGMAVFYMVLGMWMLSTAIKDIQELERQEESLFG